MPRPAPVFQKVELAPNLTVNLKQAVLECFPDAPAFIRDLVREKRISVATALEYARRVANVIKHDRLHHPEMCTYSTELTAVNAYWRWVATHYERRLDRVSDVCNQRAHTEVRTHAAFLTTGCLSRPFPGKLIVKPDPWSFHEKGASGRQVVPSQSWTLHIPVLVRNEEGVGVKRLHPVHGHEDPLNPCRECMVLELDADELQALAAAFYDAWGKDRDPFLMPIDTPLFGRPPLLGAFKGDAPPAPLGKATALLSTHTAFESILMRMKVDVTPNANVFLDRLTTGLLPDLVILDRRVLDDRVLRQAIFAKLEHLWDSAQKEGTSDAATPVNGAGQPEAAQGTV